MKKISTDNLKLLTDSERKDKYTRLKMLDWQEDYKDYDIEWNEFKEEYFKCSYCDGYDNHQCICYARN